MPSTEIFPQWIALSMAALPNAAFGVLLLIFRSKISAAVARIFPASPDKATLYSSRFVVAAGVFLIAMSLGLLAIALLTPSR